MITFCLDYVLKKSFFYHYCEIFQSLFVKKCERFFNSRKDFNCRYIRWWARSIHASVQQNGLGRKLHKSKDLSTKSRPHSELGLLIAGASPSQRKTHQLIQMMQISALSISLDTRMYPREGNDYLLYYIVQCFDLRTASALRSG